MLSQTAARHEIIVVDDGSTDGSGDLISRDFPSVTLIRQANQGVSAARNRGVQEAQSKWISFLDADDVWLPDHLAETKRGIEAFPEASLVSTAHRQIRGPHRLPLKPESTASSIRVIRYLSEATANFGCVWTSSATVRREAFTKLGGFRPFHPGEDTDLWIRLSLVGSVAISDRVTALYRRGVGGVVEELDRGTGELFLAPASLHALHPCCDVLMEQLRNLTEDDEPLRREILGFLSYLVERRSRQAFVRGDISGFRSIYSLRPEDAPKHSSFTAAMAKLPLPVLAMLHRGYRVSRRLRLSFG